MNGENYYVFEGDACLAILTVRWDVGVVNSLLYSRDWELILGIPGSKRSLLDRIFWPWDEKGRYNVKSSRLALGWKCYYRPYQQTSYKGFMAYTTILETLNLAMYHFPCGLINKWTVNFRCCREMKFI
ncbi:unnamed protein product [Cuscuta epithymum]|uniref:Uncharacterized protein n=1 Tax=Cuscuta epithymum TaxID=186058 RepID=A0AAV0DMZ0_9ASTE|nr:unnamed protein product [Cuscuta epithymum]